MKIEILMDIPVSKCNIYKGDILEVIRIEPRIYKNRGNHGYWVMGASGEVKILDHEIKYATSM